MAGLPFAPLSAPYPLGPPGRCAGPGPGAFGAWIFARMSAPDMGRVP